MFGPVCFTVSDVGVDLPSIVGGGVTRPCPVVGLGKKYRQKLKHFADIGYRF